MHPNNTKMIKQTNRRLILEVLRKSGPITIEEIMKKNRISRPTAVNIVKELTDSGIVRKSGFAESNGGRTPALLDINGNSYFAAGIDIEIPHIGVCLMNLKGECVELESWTMDEPGSPEDEMERIIGTLRRLLTKHQVKSDHLLGLGVGMPSLIDSQKNLSINTVRMREWERILIVERLGKEFETAVAIQNDIHMQALLERHINPAAGGSFAYLGIRSSGVGGAVFLHGELYQGHRGNAGFFGHLTVELEGEPCSCGNRGCLETYVSERGILERYRKEAAKHRTPMSAPLDMDSFSALVEAEDPLALKVFKYSLTCLGIGAANIIKAFDLPLVIISGLPAVAKRYFEDIVVGTARKYSMNPAAAEITVQLGQASSGDCVKGCAIMILDMFYNDGSPPRASK